MGSDRAFRLHRDGRRGKPRVALRRPDQDLSTVDIIIGEATREAAPSWAAIEIDLIAVKGKEEAENIYALLGDQTVAQSAAFKTLAARHEAMIGCYRRQEWSGALAALHRCRQYGPALAQLYDLYELRIGFYMEHPPGPSWDGIFIASTK